jgi:hypothetical protein
VNDENSSIVIKHVDHLDDASALAASFHSQLAAADLAREATAATLDCRFNFAD